MRWRETNFPCRDACPAHTEAGRYVSLISEGRYEEAYRIARLPNPLASICGRICSAPCQEACTRGNIDMPIAIRDLKRFVCERYGVESMLDLNKLKEMIGDRLKSTGKWVAIVGGGPAGLAAAHDLALFGHEVSIFEAQDVLGGMLVLGIPEFRLPREILRREIKSITNLDIDVHLGKQLGKDFTIQELFKNGYNAIFLAIGAHKSIRMEIPGEHLKGVYHGIDFLRCENLDTPEQIGNNIAIIGGGNTAIDAARTALRTGAENVTSIIYRRTRAEMPAAAEEIEDAEMEGVKINYLLAPVEIMGDKSVTGIKCVKMELGKPDASGRQRPVPVPGSEHILEFDGVIIAVSQKPDLSCLDDVFASKLADDWYLKVDPETLETQIPGIYAGGDAAFGPRDAISAIADGRRAAQSIHNYMMNQNSIRKEMEYIYIPDSLSFSPTKDFDKISPQKVPKSSLEISTGIANVGYGFSEEQAQNEASRCLQCWINTIFDGNEEDGTECLLCGGCEDICPENCIEIASGMEITEGQSLLIDMLQTKDEPVAGDDKSVIGALILKDETRCIRCGLCAQRCPVDCINLEALIFRGTG